MIPFEPGIFNLAHSKGIQFLEDVDGNGRIDNADLKLALKAKAAAQGGTNVRPEHSGS